MQSGIMSTRVYYERLRGILLCFFFCSCHFPSHVPRRHEKNKMGRRAGAGKEVVEQAFHQGIPRDATELSEETSRKAEKKLDDAGFDGKERPSLDRYGSQGAKRGTIFRRYTVRFASREALMLAFGVMMRKMT